MANDKKPWPVLVGQYMGLGVLLPAATFVGYALGYLLDKAFGTHWIYIPGLLIGIAAGLLQVVRHVLQDTRDE